MASDAQSLASWAWQLFAGKVVSQESLTTMMTVDPDGDGLGLDKMTDFGSTTAFGHTGSKDGYQSQFFVFPDGKSSSRSSSIKATWTWPRSPPSCWTPPEADSP